MISAINTANRNNNVQNNVNFKGKGKIETIPFALTDELIQVLRTRQIIMDSARGSAIMNSMIKHSDMPWLFHVIETVTGIPIDTMKKVWSHLNFGEIGRKYDDLQEVCVPVAELKRFNPTVIASRPWDKSGMQGLIGDFEPELVKLLHDNNIINEQRIFEGMPAHTMTIRPGYQKFADEDLANLARKVIIEGTESESPVLESAKCNALVIEGAKIPDLKAEANAAIIQNSQIGSIVAEQELSIANSTIGGDVTSKAYATFSGKNQIGGNLSVRYSPDFIKSSELTVKRNMSALNIAISPGTKLIVDGSIGTKDKRVDRIILQRNGSSLKAGETHAIKLYAPRNTHFETDVWDIERAPFRAEFGHQIDRIRRWVESLGERAIDVASLMKKMDNTKL